VIAPRISASHLTDTHRAAGQRPGDDPIEDFTRHDGQHLRRTVSLRNGRRVGTTMGTVDTRDREGPGASADRAYITRAVRPSEGSGRPARVVDLFAGCGGLSLGLWEACRAVNRGFIPAAAIDLDATALGVYQEHFPDVDAINEDVADILTGRPNEKLKPSERIFRRKTGASEFLLAGPPCQGFSSLNNHTRGNDPKNGLYQRVARAAQILEPDHVIIENVIGITNDSSEVLERTAQLLDSFGYHISAGVVRLLDIGVPQKRQRHVLVASTDKTCEVEAVVRSFRQSPRDLRWAIGDLSRKRSASGYDAPSIPSPENIKRMQYLRKHSVFDLPNRLRPPCHRDEEHSYRSMYGRLRWGRPAQTITSGFGSMGQGRYVHPNGRRTLTPHEAARLQMFPDWFSFGDLPKTSVATMIGNAVPFKLSYVFGLWLLR
jgi:DNA (cytosine-5)-methyltransferase 1